jgi:hypothetical protein
VVVRVVWLIEADALDDGYVVDVEDTGVTFSLRGAAEVPVLELSREQSLGTVGAVPDFVEFPTLVQFPRDGRCAVLRVRRAGETVWTSTILPTSAPEPES